MTSECPLRSGSPRTPTMPTSPTTSRPRRASDGCGAHWHGWRAQAQSNFARFGQRDELLPSDQERCARRRRQRSLRSEEPQEPMSSQRRVLGDAQHHGEPNRRVRRERAGGPTVEYVPLMLTRSQVLEVRRTAAVARAGPARGSAAPVAARPPPADVWAAKQWRRRRRAVRGRPQPLVAERG